MAREDVKTQQENLSEIAAAFPEEIVHLENITEKICLELAEAERSVEQMDEEYRETQLYMAEHRNEGDAKEMFQSEMALRQIDSLGASAVVFRDKLRKTKASPYFARIDFLPETGDEGALAYYIGLYAFRHERQLLIIDWRSPVASMFYDFELGHAKIFPQIATYSRLNWLHIDPESLPLVTTFENSHSAKPNPAYYKEVCESLKVAPEDCIMIGNDVAEDGIAKKLGMEVMLIEDCLLNKDNLPTDDFQMGSLKDLLEWAKSLPEVK